MHTCLIQFNRLPQVECKADGGEKVAHGGLGLLRLCFGKSVKVTENHLFKAEDRPLLVRIAAIVLAVLILPVTLILTAIGSIGLACSKSHPGLVDKYLAGLITNTPKPVSNAPPLEVPPQPSQPNPPPSPSPFTKKFERAAGIDFSSVWAKPQVKAALEHLQKDKLLANLLNVWLLRENQMPESKNLNLVDAVFLQLAKGTCYGQAMNILELLGSNKAEAISDQFIIDNMNWQHYVYFQILHTLDVFLDKQGNATLVNGVNVRQAKKHLTSIFPHHNRKGYSTHRWKFAEFDKEKLIGEFSDFIKQHVRGNHSTSDQHDYAVQITLTGEKFGHAGIIYYSETQKRYFWYDPYRRDYGLFSCADHKAFFNGLADKLLEYKTEKIFTHLKFTAYKI